ncbi:hypothetical protein V8E51_019727 [Hyaloscypha variabilis]
MELSPNSSCSENTPLFIGFTRNWRLLQQAVVSYITAGWPPEDIYIVENTGVMKSNANGQLSLQNPFFLKHTRLDMLGVNVLITPTLITFAQLQNYYIWYAENNSWDYYWWSHMDVAALLSEDKCALESRNQTIFLLEDRKPEYSVFSSLHQNCVAVRRKLTALDPEIEKVNRWAQQFHSYNRLALVNTKAYIEEGGIPRSIFTWLTDRDLHARIEMAGFEIGETVPGMIFDMGSSLDDLSAI